MDFVDRLLKCSDCGSNFIFTAGEQLFFFDRQFKNDPKRCKLCKAKRAGLGQVEAGPSVPAMLPLSRTETRTECSACGIQTTVPFRPTQGRPVFCRSCFQLKRTPNLPDPVLSIHANSSAATMAAITEVPLTALQAVDFAADIKFSPSLDLRLPQVAPPEIMEAS